MTGRADYAVIQIEDEKRSERLNAAIAIFTSDGFDVRIPRRLEKLRAMSNALNVDHVRESLERLHELDEICRKSGVREASARIEMITQMAPFRFSEPSNFVAPTADAYEDLVKRLMRLLIEPEPAPVKAMAKRTRLSSALRAALRKERILARKGEGLGAHRVVPNVQIADGLSADFVLKNGAMHIVETVDATSETASLRKTVADIAVSALVLEQARMTFGEQQTTSRLIYDASAAMEKLATPSLEATAHQGAELINWASHDDRRSFLVSMAMLADPLPTKREERLAAVHASTQGRLKLN